MARTHDRGSALKGPGEIFKTLIDIYQNVSGVGDGLGAGEDENLNDTGDPDQEEKEEKEDGDSDGGEGGGGEGEGGGRCPSASASPLSGHDATAVAWSLPGVLAELAEAGACPVPALRLWGTLLAIEALRSIVQRVADTDLRVPVSEKRPGCLLQLRFGEEVPAAVHALGDAGVLAGHVPSYYDPVIVTESNVWPRTFPSASWPAPAC